MLTAVFVAFARLCAIAHLAFASLGVALLALGHALHATSTFLVSKSGRSCHEKNG
jgi:hypothetical protein